jgi:hypothetical protein
VKNYKKKQTTIAYLLEILILCTFRIVVVNAVASDQSKAMIPGQMHKKWFFLPLISEAQSRD